MVSPLTYLLLDKFNVPMKLNHQIKGLEFRLSRSKSAIAQRPANVHTRTATVAGDQL
ncbi:hypothetical protein QUA79_11600 [Microcoleus sp. F8-D1]